MSNLIPLSRIPYRARAAEATERAKWPIRAMAYDAASYEIVAAAGCYSGAQPPSHGWVLTHDAATAISDLMTYMPGGTCHQRQTFIERAQTSNALGEYVEAVKRGTPKNEAVGAYLAAKKG